ncbi:hypothetical protein TIFTF001_052083, partial [Ficus carica]
MEGGITAEEMGFEGEFGETRVKEARVHGGKYLVNEELLSISIVLGAFYLSLDIVKLGSLLPLLILPKPVLLVQVTIFHVVTFLDTV